MKAFVYLLKCENMFKIGKANDVEDRINQLKKHYTFDLDNSYSIEVGKSEATNLEKTLHCIFEKDRINDLPPAEGSTEFFKLDCLDDVLNMVEKISEHKDIKLKKGILLRPKKNKVVKNKRVKKKKFYKNMISIRHTIIYIYYVLKNATRTVENENESVFIYENTDTGVGSFLFKKVFRKVTILEHGAGRVFTSISGNGCPKNNFECDELRLTFEPRIIIEYFEESEPKTYKEKYVAEYIKKLN